MQDWFKARNNWGAGIETLSDEEAGQFVKALWAYTMRGEEQELSGSAKALYAIVLMNLKKDERPRKERHWNWISAWAKDKERRFDISNGITLCNRCHKAIHTRSHHEK